MVRSKARLPGFDDFCHRGAGSGRLNKGGCNRTACRSCASDQHCRDAQRSGAFTLRTDIDTGQCARRLHDAERHVHNIRPNGGLERTRKAQRRYRGAGLAYRCHAASEIDNSRYYVSLKRLVIGLAFLQSDVSLSSISRLPEAAFDSPHNCTNRISVVGAVGGSSTAWLVERMVPAEPPVTISGPRSPDRASFEFSVGCRTARRLFRDFTTLRSG
jgi:hypothetical protein